MLEDINEVKILYNKRFNDWDALSTNDYISLNFNSFMSIYDFIANNILIEQDSKLQVISFMGQNLFDNFETGLLPILNFLKNAERNFLIKLYFNEFEGSEDIFKILSMYNLQLYYILGYKEFKMPEKKINLILKYFPLAHFTYCFTPENIINFPMIDIWEYYSRYNLFYFYFDFEYEKKYPENFSSDFDTLLTKIDTDIINQLKNYSINTIPNNYKYMLWKIGALDFCTNYRPGAILPQKMCAYCCGFGCYKNLIIDNQKNIYTCYKIINKAPEITNNFLIGNIETGINEEKITKLIESKIDINGILLQNPDVKEPVKLYQEETCNKCILNSVCSQGCLPVNYMVNNDFISISNTFCFINHSFYNHTLNIINYFEAIQNNFLFKNLFTGCLKLGENNYEC